MDNNYQQPYQQPPQQGYQPQPPYQGVQPQCQGPQPQYQGYQPPCQQPQSPDNRPPMPDAHLSKAIVTTVLICVPFGIVSIIKAANVERLYNEGKIDEAYELANSANKWANWGIITGIVGVALYLIFYILVLGVVIAEDKF